LFCSYISDNYASDFVIFGMFIAMDQACRWVIKYFYCLLGNDAVQPGSRSRHSSDLSVTSSFVSLCAGWRWTFWTLFL